MLSKKEAIAFCLFFSNNNRIGSKTKLNKIVASLNVNGIPVNTIFILNKNGSFCEELTEGCEDILSEYAYNYGEKKGISFTLTDKGKELAKEVLHRKILIAFDELEISTIKERINYFNSLDSSSLSEFEHIKLKVNIDDRFKLNQTSNSVNIDYLDIYSGFMKIKTDSFATIDLKGISQFYFYLSGYLRKKFNKLDDTYQFGALMINYYLLFLLQEQIEIFKIPVEDLLVNKNKSLHRLNRGYDAVQELIKIYDYPFSLENPKISEVVGNLSNN